MCVCVCMCSPQLKEILRCPDGVRKRSGGRGDGGLKVQANTTGSDVP